MSAAARARPRHGGAHGPRGARRARARLVRSGLRAPTSPPHLYGQCVHRREFSSIKFVIKFSAQASPHTREKSGTASTTGLALPIRVGQRHARERPRKLRLRRTALARKRLVGLVHLGRRLEHDQAREHRVLIHVLPRRLPATRRLVIPGIDQLTSLLGGLVACRGGLHGPQAEGEDTDARPHHDLVPLLRLRRCRLRVLVPAHARAGRAWAPVLPRYVTYLSGRAHQCFPPGPKPM